MLDRMDREEAEIINIVVNIFQNVGIKRWIDQISALCNEQIYFQICKIIFPETIIQLFRLSEDNTLSTGEKIQGVIDIIAKLLKNDLYHISGQAIAKGKLNHLKNFLQLLSALSDNVISKDQIDVKSAPQKDNSQCEDLDQAYYTVIGIDKEFEKHIYYDSEGHSSENTVTSVDQNPKVQENRGKQVNLPQDDISSGEFPIQPKGDKFKRPKNHYSQKKEVKFNLKPSQKKTESKKSTVANTFAGQQKNKDFYVYPIPLKDKNSDIMKRNIEGTKQYVKKTQKIMEQLQKKRIYDLNNDYEVWQSQENIKQIRLRTNIDNQSSKRSDFINHKINEREEVINSLRGEEFAINNIKSLFREQNKIQKHLKQKEWSKNLFECDKLLRSSTYKSELEKAINSNHAHRRVSVK